jgi:hypothetical protein
MVPVRGCGRRIVALAIGAALAHAAVRDAGAQSSVYVPVDDVAYAFIDALLPRGALPSLSALDRPYTTRDIRAALEAGRSQVDSPALRGWRDALDRALRRFESPGDDPARLWAQATAGAALTGQSSARRELMLADATSGAYPALFARGQLGAGRVVGSAGIGRL